MTRIGERGKRGQAAQDRLSRPAADPLMGISRAVGKGVGPDGVSSQCPLLLGMLADDSSAGAILEFLCCTFKMKGKKQKQEKR